MKNKELNKYYKWLQIWASGIDTLADNGGPTQPHALFDGSPAIGNATSARATASDQRGRPDPFCSAVALQTCWH